MFLDRIKSSRLSKDDENLWRFWHDARIGPRLASKSGTRRKRLKRLSAQEAHERSEDVFKAVAPKRSRL
ncbi:hypothetical protein B0T39_23110 [Chromobacterium haemolyticum]|nr:hypothetical protein B0T39_23110 [Chromobacterium haemolyticum]